MYQSLYDDQHRFHVFSNVRTVPNRYAQKGLREKLLCAECEQRLGVHERYVSLIMTGQTPLTVERHHRLLVVQGVDYKSFRLFQLSVLWRAGVSSLPFFSHVNLASHEEKLRRLVLNEETGPAWQYGCVMFALFHAGKLQEDILVQPTKARIGNVFGYRFVFAGHVWVFMVANHRHHKRALETVSLDPSGEVRILMSELSQAQFITDFGEILKEQQKI
jgi:hypothetical protein